MNIDEDRRILEAELWKLSPRTQLAAKNILAKLDEKAVTDEALDFLNSLPALPINFTEITKSLLEKLNDALNALKNAPAVWVSRKNLPHEIWRDVVGYERHYQISNYGRAKSLKRGRVEILRQIKTRGDYLYVALFRDNQRKNFRVHQLVAQAFLANPEGKPEVHHRNHCKSNNSVWNLEWATPKENTNYARQAGLIKGKPGAENPLAKLTEEDVRYIRRVYVPRHPEFGATAMAEKFQLNRQVLYDALHRRTYKNIP